MSKSKRQIRDTLGESAYQLYTQLMFEFENRFYNLYRSNWKVEGVTDEEEKYILDQFWKRGQIAAFNDAVGDTHFAKFTKTSNDMYGYPYTVRLTNEWCSPIIPANDLIVQGPDANCALGYLNSSQKGLLNTVRYFLERIAQAEMLIHNQLKLMNCPYLIPIEAEDKDKMNDIVSRILNNELVIFAEDVNPAMFKAIQTGVQYYIDKIQIYEDNLINQIKLILGVQNAGMNKVEQIQMAQVTSTGSETSGYETDYIHNLEKFSKRCKEVLGKDIKFIRTVECTMQGQAHDMEEKAGPKDYLMEE